jgi:2-oxoglutarate ferredoxin oxidoreductase subunit delta
MPTIQVMVERCKGCERCNDACPQKIVGMSPKLNTKGYHYAVLDDPPRCIGCRMCAVSCPDVAIEVFVEGAQYEFFPY